MASKKPSTRSRSMRWYTAGVALVTGISVSVAIEMREVADQAQRDRAHAAAARTYVATADKHAKETAVAIRKLTKQYAVALTTANRTQARMLADLRKARKAARLAQTISMAPVVYSTSFSAAAGVSAAAASAPTTGTS